jgi:hypothetical protein
MRERANLAFDHLLGDFDGGFTEGSSVLGTHLCPHSQIGRVITVGLARWVGRERGGREKMGSVLQGILLTTVVKRQS